MKPIYHKPCNHAFRNTEQTMRGKVPWVRVTCRDCGKFLGYHPRGEAEPKKGRKK